MIWKDNEDIRLIECTNTMRAVQRELNLCREERRPYVFVTNTMITKSLHTILVPVSMLEEEVYKAEICSYLARKTGAMIMFFCAHDYGSKAKRNMERMMLHLRTVSDRTGEEIRYEVMAARKDSFGLMREASERQRELGYDLLLLTASREYGLDDVLFGPPERYAIRHCPVPVMLVNPRADLFSLCD